MYIAMNRFQVRRGDEDDFERVWKERDSRLKEVPGFLQFHLLRGATDETCTLYASHTVWASRADFEAWTQSQAFRDAHRTAGDHKHMYLDRPRFEGFDVVQHYA